MIWALFLSTVVAKRNQEFIELEERELDSEITQHIFCGQEWLGLTHDHSLYRSTNQGFAWVNLSKVGQIYTLQVSPANPKVITMLGIAGNNWVTEDCGETIRDLHFSKQVSEFKFHPHESTWALAATWSQCAEPTIESCDFFQDLYITKTLGEKWSRVTKNVVQFDWVQEASSQDRICVVYVPYTAHPRVYGWTHKVDLVVSDDYFQTVETLVPRGSQFTFTQDYLIVAQASGLTDINLLVSKDWQHFDQVELPLDRLPEHGFLVLDASEGSVFLLVNLFGASSEFGNLYISDAGGNKYSPSLLHVAQTQDGFADFAKVYGLEGIYIANCVDPSIQPVQRSKKTVKEPPPRQTFITFDKGGIWHRLKAPEVDANGEDYPCGQNCTLHLHSHTHRSYPQIYSIDTAAGIVLGTGNVGDYLTNKVDEVNTYMSRDGGLTWTEVSKGSHIFEIGNHGAVLILADNRKATNTLRYSLNEGLTWEVLRFAEKPLEVKDVVKAADSFLRFLVLGTRGAAGISVEIDFSAVLKTQCQGSESPDAPDSDYTWWSPRDGWTQGTCLMGRTVKYVRKKRAAECFIGADLVSNRFAENCECADEDYECDTGYYRDEANRCSVLTQAPEPVCESGVAFISVSTGYRKIAGDSCSLGVMFKYRPRRISCSSSTFLPFLWLTALVFPFFFFWNRLLDRWHRLFPDYSKLDPEDEDEIRMMGNQ